MLYRGATVVGLDLDLDAMREASKEASAKGLASAARRRARPDGRDAPGRCVPPAFADGSFDRIICSEVMEHVHDYRAAIRELYRVAKLGAKVAITIPTATSEHLYLRLGDEYFESPGGHIRIFRPRDLAEGNGRGRFRHRRLWLRPRLPHPLPGPAQMHLPTPTTAHSSGRIGSSSIRATGSPLMAKLERALNFVCPKSIILYGDKPADGSAPANADRESRPGGNALSAAA